MAKAPISRKRVQAPRRGPGGSAFQKCEVCGVFVAVALSDMHECSSGGGRKRGRGGSEGLGTGDQPRSAFRCFMESFKKICKTKNWMAIDRGGFGTWKNMSPEERHQYFIEAKKVNSAYDELLVKEMNDISEVDDEADSASVGKFDPRYEGPMYRYYYPHRWEYDDDDGSYDLDDDS